MRVVPCIVVVTLLLAGFSGCQLFDKKNNSSDVPFLGAKSSDSPKSTQTADPLLGAANSNADLDGLLAGRVIDGAGRPADAQIRWVCLDDAKAEDAPLEVAVNAQGYFMIQGLKSGKHYKLITFAKSGDKTLEVVTLTQVPNTRLLIQVNEKFAVPGNPQKGKADKGKKSTGSGKEQPASVQIPIPMPGWPQHDAPMLPPAGAFGDKSRIAGEITIRPPTAEVPNGLKAAIPVPPLQITPSGPSPFSIPHGSAPIPSSRWIGSRLENFALYDISFQPWELRTKRRANLVLLDFWKTNCPPCLQTIPSLRDVQEKFGAQGLQVIGIAYEDVGNSKEQAAYVANVANRRNANYQLLLGGGQQCPLKRDLQVQAYPTLVLIDESGVVLWRHEGELDRASLDDLTFMVQRRLSMQQY